MLEALQGTVKAIAQDGNEDKAKILKGMREREKKGHSLETKVSQRKTFYRQHHYDINRNKVNITDKTDIKQATLKNNEEKFRQSSKNLFLSFPLRA